MAQPTLYIDGRSTVNGKKSQINFDNPIALHTFVNSYLKTLPQFADNAAAVTGNLKVGDLYINTTDAVVPVIAIVV